MTITDYNQRPGSDSQRGAGQAPASPSNACVLLVEDHEDTRFLLKTILEMRGGINVVEATNGEMAVALAENVQVDLILMDTNLPLLDGITATQRIRALTSRREVPIVILSGHAQPAAQARAFAAGCTFYLVKPFRIGDLDGVLEQYLAQSKAT